VKTKIVIKGELTTSANEDRTVKLTRKLRAISFINPILSRNWLDDGEVGLYRIMRSPVCVRLCLKSARYSNVYDEKDDC